MTDRTIVHLHTDPPLQIEVEEQDEPDGLTFRYTVRDVSGGEDVGLDTAIPANEPPQHGTLPLTHSG